MKTANYYATICLLLCAFWVTNGYSESQTWPIKGQIDLSDGFGEFRQGHFHTGIDLRTGGRIGEKVYAPVDGYLYRVKMSYYGSGKALYLKGNDGYIYAFFHLAKFTKKINEPVFSTQIATQRYYQDIYFKEDSIKITKGELIGFSGQTGVGAPHLHFEKRTADNVPVNPLVYGFKLNDNIHPVFDQVIFKQVDEKSLFDNGKRELSFKVTKKNNIYSLDTLVALNSPFAVMVGCYDRMKEQGMKQAIYNLQLYFDDELFYQVTFDSLGFDYSRMTELEYDYHRAVNKEDHIRNLFKKTGNIYNGSKPLNGKNGIFGLSGKDKYGRHQAKIIATDASGNSSTLKFSFLWTPPEYIFTLDSIVKMDKQNSHFFFTPVKEYRDLGIDSVAAFLNRGDAWGKLNGSSTEFLSDGSLVCKVTGNTIDRAVLRLVGFVSPNGIIVDNIFNGILESGKPAVDFDFDIVEDGILINIDGRVRNGCKSHVKLYYQDQLLGIETPQFFTMVKHICFIPPRPEYKRIDRIDVSLSSDTTFPGKSKDSLDIYLVGLGENEEINLDDQFFIKLGKNNLYQPLYISIEKKFIDQPVYKKIMSNVYYIRPDVFLCKENFDIIVKFNRDWKYYQNTGVCWLDTVKNSWVWLDTEVGDNVISAKSAGGGVFAAVTDYVPPVISNLNYRSDETYYENDKPIIFNVIDTLSGIDDDLDIVVKVDGKWQLSEYDPENDRVEVTLIKPLSEGSHHLGIMITDKAGNLQEQYLNFIVNDNRKKTQGK